jgi:3-hydroxymyristoyl/3-hydroxydecanoyl-(acyl carrier protein) dehydratase
MRHYWVDRITHLEVGVRATGVKAVALSEDEFEAHFPGNPVLPGIYLLEGLAQTAGVLLNQTTGGKRVALMASVDRARFVAFARPGDRVELQIELESLENELARVRGAASVGERPIASARLTFRLVDPASFIPAAFRPFWEQAMNTWLGRYPESDNE